MTELDKTYKVQDGCHNCEHAFVKTEYEDGPEYFCHRDDSERPECLSVRMGEHRRVSSAAAWLKASKDWDTWARPRWVEACGICDHHV